MGLIVGGVDGGGGLVSDGVSSGALTASGRSSIVDMVHDDDSSSRMTRWCDALSLTTWCVRAHKPDSGHEAKVSLKSFVPEVPHAKRSGTDIGYGPLSKKVSGEIQNIKQKQIVKLDYS